MKASDLKSKSIDELNAECANLTKQLFVLRMQKGFQTKQKTHLFKSLKRDIARVKTIMTQMERASS